MSQRVFSAVMFFFLLTSMFVLAFNIQPVRASGTIYIRADGSIDPPTASISSADNATYTLIDDVSSDSGYGIVIERDNIVVEGAGYTLQGSGTGIDLSGRANVTVQKTQIKNFYYGIYLQFSSNNSINGNNITNNDIGIYLESSSNNIVSGNNITNNLGGILLGFSSNNSISENNIANNGEGILLSYSSNNSIGGNNIANNGEGILLDSSSNNIMSGNNITNNSYGVKLYDSSDYNSIGGNNIANNGEGILLDSSSYNVIYHNNLVRNTQQVYFFVGYANVWDDGYPSGGNYWSDYDGTDLYSGVYQNETGGDNIGDTPYVIDANNQDRYPLARTRIPDINGDGTVDILDAIWVSNSFMIKRGEPGYNPNVDINYDGVVDILDGIILANHFLEHYP